MTPADDAAPPPRRGAAHLRKYRVVPSLTVDGDTFDAALFATFRLAGIDAPELGTPEGEAARMYQELWWRKHPKARAIPVGVDCYGRILVRVVPSKGPSLAECLVAEGLAERLPI